jgi:hypothetical protein
MNEKIELPKRYPLNMDRYLTDSERNDIGAMVTDSGVDWSGWKRKLESREVSAACQAIKVGARPRDLGTGGYHL